LHSLPGYVDGASLTDIPKETAVHHGHLKDYITPALDSMADVYRAIFEVTHEAVDISDIIERRKILVVLLPAIDDSEQTTRQMMSMFDVLLRRAFGVIADSKLAKDKAGGDKKEASAPFLLAIDFLEKTALSSRRVEWLAEAAISAGAVVSFRCAGVSGMKREFGAYAEKLIDNAGVLIRTDFSDKADDPGARLYRPVLSSEGIGHIELVPLYVSERK
jgi:hypothetical protein